MSYINRKYLSIFTHTLHKKVHILYIKKYTYFLSLCLQLRIEKIAEKRFFIHTTYNTLIVSKRKFNAYPEFLTRKLYMAASIKYYGLVGPGEHVLCVNSGVIIKVK